MIKLPDFNIISYFVGAFILISAFLAIEFKNKFDSFVALSVVSLMSVLLFVLLRAPDVAITEAAVGSGLVTAVLVFALWRIGGEEK